MQLAQVTLDDKYNLQSGRVYLNGVQALVRLPIMQVQRDAAAGLKTGGFISGYRGSPLGAYDYSPGSTRTSRRLPSGAASRSIFTRAPPSMASSASGTARVPASTARPTR